MVFNYALLPLRTASEHGLDINRLRVELGESVIVNQTDLHAFGDPEDSLSVKVEKLGGRIISAKEAKTLIANTKK